MSTDFYLHSKRDNTCIYIGYSWGAGAQETTIEPENRRLVADWIGEHMGESVVVWGEPRGTVVERDGPGPSQAELGA